MKKWLCYYRFKCFKYSKPLRILLRFWHWRLNKTPLYAFHDGEMRVVSIKTDRSHEEIIAWIDGRLTHRELVEDLQSSPDHRWLLRKILTERGSISQKG